jgi:hypothetical protein
MGERTHKLEFRFDEASLNGEKATDRLTVGEWLEVEAGKRDTLVKVLCRFAWYDGQPLDEATALEKVKAVNMTIFNDLLYEMKEIVQGVAVRPPNGADSETP